MPKTLLIADDSVVIQKSIGITFAQEDVTIACVSNGNEAIAKAKQMKPDVILADVVMPQKNGYEVCEAARQDPQLRGVPILLLAGTHEPFDENRAKAVGASGYIIKPFESQALIDKVKELMAKGASAAAPPPTPASPASTIAGQAPMSRQAPMLDMEPPAPAKPEPTTAGEFEFSLDAPEAAAPETPPPPAETSSTLPAGEFWDFAADAGDAAAPAVEAPAPAQDGGAWGTIAAGNWEEMQPPPASEPTQTVPTTTEPIPTENTEFSFDLSNQEMEPEPTTVSAAPAAEEIEPPSVMAVAHADEPTAAPISLSDAQIEAIVAKVFHKVIERIAWEVVPDLAETIIKEELSRLTKENP